MTGSVATLVAAVLPSWPSLAAADRQQVLDQSVAFVATEIALAPAHVRLGIRTLTGVFLVAARLAGGRGFARQTPAWQSRFFESWGGLLPQTQAMMRLYRSLTVLAFYEHPLVLRALEVEAPADRTARFRDLRRTALATATP